MMDTLIGFLQTYGYAVIFVSVLLESAGLPFPGESIILAAGLMAGHGELDIVGVVLAAFIGGTLGDNIGYWLGHRYGRAFLTRYGSRWGMTDDKLAYVEDRFRRWGPPIVLVARFILVLRQLCGFAAGTLRFPWWEFLFFNAAGAALWSGAYGVGAYVFGNQLRDVLEAHPLAYVGIAAVFLGAAGLTILRFRSSMRKMREKSISLPKEGSEGGPRLG